ncbi:MAG: DNA-processing protein DprA [Bacteroidota bacterium]
MNILDLLRLTSVPRLGPLKIRALISRFGDPTEVLTASPRELHRVPGIDKKLASSIVRHDGRQFAEGQLSAMNLHGARIITAWDLEFPILLRKIYDPPPLLFVLGRFAEADAQALSIVGTRKPSSYGHRIAEMFAEQLVMRAITIVSGLARGIDTAAHSGALKGNGRTIAVIGSGLDVPYPPENRGLMERIAEKGVVVSEFPFGTQPEAQNFPRRNRLISGLSLGTIVVESDQDGGAMITASTALDQNREVFAVPGMITEKRSIGPHTLIRDSRAKLIHSVEDILVELPMILRDAAAPQEQRPLPQLTLFETKIYESLSQEPMHIDMIADTTGLTTPDGLVALLSLEFKGLVRQLPGKYFQRMEEF